MRSWERGGAGSRLRYLIFHKLVVFTLLECGEDDFTPGTLREWCIAAAAA